MKTPAKSKTLIFALVYIAVGVAMGLGYDPDNIDGFREALGGIDPDALIVVIGGVITAVLRTVTTGPLSLPWKK